jgi:hypothetical protein
MDISFTIVQGLEPSWTSLLLLPLSILTLLLSMMLADRWLGGVAFGSVDWLLPRAALLCGVVTAINYVSWGIVLSAVIWYVGLIWLFDLTAREATVLTQINWPIMLLWRVLIAILQA